MSRKLIEHRNASAGSTAFVGDSRVRVSDIARLYESMQMDLMVERIRQAIPHLSEEEITAAIRYWSSHRQEIAAEIERDQEVLRSLEPAD